ncbi:hypothetical protein H6F43_03780 [Leptolyngbya sp. FACHB-36]|uniref:hypothetical protein n=1 Tax=Leptolyngbya sp. FACHB-36 TaxID=2692808 RepID=UPI0016818D07|nr:hypothetical protein [Leptolyngbya sp. FACHB-36]MBD2019302.1 hypothetical protein [Leptolyngbya sp. FACHB-36]
MQIFWLFVGFLRQIFNRPQSSVACPWCGYMHYHEQLEVEREDSGKYSDGESTCHWASGVATCPRCSYKFQYDAST